MMQSGAAYDNLVFCCVIGREGRWPASLSRAHFHLSQCARSASTLVPLMGPAHGTGVKSSRDSQRYAPHESAAPRHPRSAADPNARRLLLAPQLRPHLSTNLLTLG